MEKYQRFNAYDKPIQYKLLYIYPVLVEDYFDFQYAVSCLLLDKNKIGSQLEDKLQYVKLIGMSYLDFLFWYIFDQEENLLYVNLLYLLFAICLRIPHETSEEADELINRIIFDQDENGKWFIVVDGYVYDRNDFKEIRDIIASQNIIELPESSNLHPDMKKLLDEAKAFKESGMKKMCDFEEQIIIVALSLKVKLEDVYKMTIRKFFKVISREDAKIHYQIYKTAEMGGMVTFKVPIDHWMSDLNEDKYKNVKVDYDQFVSNVNSKDVQISEKSIKEE